MANYIDIQIAGGDTATPLSLNKRIQLISTFCNLAKVRFLDCGCGAGEYVFALRDTYGTDAWGVEYSADKVAKAKANARHSARIRQGDLQELHEPDCCFDVVLLNEVLEHVPSDTQALREVHRVLKQGGKLIVFSPNRMFPFETHGVGLRAVGIRVSPGVPFIPYVPLGVGRFFLDYWARNYWPYELRKLVRSAGFTIMTCSYIWQTFENISGHQPVVVRHFRAAFRRVAGFCERNRILRRFGVSQVIVAQKGEAAPSPGEITPT